MKRILVVALVLTAAAGAALAADLSASDYRTLQQEFGLKRDGRFVQDMTPDERAELGRLLNDKNFVDAPKVRADNAADFLYHVHLRECHSWQQSSGDPASCPPAGDATINAGQKIAERQCNYCHLFGTPSAPSFHKMAEKGLTQPQLVSALQTGHQMSPIGLAPDEVAALHAYIASQK